MHRQPRAGEFGDEVDTDAGIFILGTGRSRAQGFGPEHDAVIIDRDAKDFLKNRRELLGRVFPHAEQIEVARGAIGGCRPQAEQHRALEHEPLAMWRQAETKQQAFDDIAGHQQLCVFPTLAGARRQAITHRDRHVLRRPAHVMASR